MSLLRPVLACLTFGVVLGPFAAPEAAGAPCGGVKAGPEWTTISAPEFPPLDGPAPGPAHSIAAFAVAPRLPDRIWVTNGDTVMRTDDGGCTWTEEFSLDLLPSLDIPVSEINTTIRAVEVPEASGAQDEVHLLVDEQVGPVHRVHVVSSSDAGANWTARDSGLPPTSGAPIELVVAPSDADALYLLLQGSPATGAEVWATDNGGGTWELRGEASGANRVRVDPLNADELWFGGSALLHSVDGGRNSSEIKYVSNPVGVIDVFHAPGAPSRIMAYQVEGQSFMRSDDGGKTWVALNAPRQPMISMAHGNSPDEMILTAHGTVHRFRAPSYWIEVTPGLIQGVKASPDYEDILDIQVSRTEAPHAFGFTSDTIERYTGFSIVLPPITPTAPAGGGIAELVSSRDEVRIPPGGQRKVDYDLSLPPQPTPLDVFFLMDTTQSMDSSINGLLKGMHQISSDLARSKIDVWFGVGEFKDYPIPGYGDPISGDFPYRLNRKMGPADASLVAAIEEMQASGGGDHHLPESQLTALYQSVTGAGEPGFVDANQDAGFRSGAVKVVVLITDAGFEDSAAHPSPPFSAVAGELTADGVYQVGLAVYGPWGVKAALADLEEMAQATGTRVPPGGVDCDGDGVKELTAGAPLVCEVDDAYGHVELAPAIIATLRAITDIAPVELVATKGARLVDDISPTYPSVDVKDPQTLAFTVTYACPEIGRVSETVKLVGTVRGTGVAGVSTDVVCRPGLQERRRGPGPAPPLPPADRPVVAAVPIPPAPAPPASQLQSQPNPHAQAALAQQEQQQPEVAMAQSLDDQMEEEFAMSSFDRRARTADAGVLLLYGAGLASGMATALRLRTRTRAAHGRRLR